MPLLTSKRVLLQRDIIVSEASLRKSNEHSPFFYCQPSYFNSHSVLRTTDNFNVSDFLDSSRGEAYNSIILVLGEDQEIQSPSDLPKYRYYSHITIDISINDIRVQSLVPDFSIHPVVIRYGSSISDAMYEGRYYGSEINFEVSSTKLPQRIEVTSDIGPNEDLSTYCTVLFSDGTVESKGDEK